jgi:hypothetical protein
VSPKEKTPAINATVIIIRRTVICKRGNGMVVTSWQS